MKWLKSSRRQTRDTQLCKDWCNRALVHILNLIWRAWSGITTNVMISLSKFVLSLGENFSVVTLRYNMTSSFRISRSILFYPVLPIRSIEQWTLLISILDDLFLTRAISLKVDVATNNWLLFFATISLFVNFFTEDLLNTGGQIWETPWFIKAARTASNSGWRFIENWLSNTRFFLNLKSMIMGILLDQHKDHWESFSIHKVENPL